MLDEVTLVESKPASATARNVILIMETLGSPEEGPFAPGSEGAFLLRLGSLIASGSGGRLLLYSVVLVPEGESVSAYSIAAQARRQDLERSAFAALTGAEQPGEDGKSPLRMAEHAEAPPTTIVPVVRVTTENDLAGEVRRLVQEEPNALLMLPLSLPGRRGGGPPWLKKALRKPLPCDLVWARPGTGPEDTHPLQVGTRLLLPARGGPQAEMALDLAQNLVDAIRAQVTVLHVLQDLPEMERAPEEAPFTELLAHLPTRKSGSIRTRRIVDPDNNPVQTVSRASHDYEMVIMGAGGEQAADPGRFTDRVARQTPAALMVLKTRVPVGPAIRAARKRARPHVLDPETLSLIVDKWFAENTFHAEEFSDLSRLIDIKRKRGVTISLGLPALNEEATVGGVIRVLKQSLMQDVPLLDEIVVIDSDSTDATRDIAREMGVPVYVHQDILPEAGPPHPGKGEALWKSLHVLKGDLIAWVDTDVSNMHPQFVYGLLGPLLREPRIGYVKGYYHRPIKSGEELQSEGGGRVTELTVRPLINLFFPLLSGLVQPLAGEYAGRRDVLERLPFFTGYGVETGMLIDLLEHFGLSSIGQVNLETRVHRNRALSDLSLTAFAIVQVILTRLQERSSIKLLEEVNSSMKLIRFEKEHLSLDVQKVRDAERPPIADIPAYREARARLGL